MKGGKLATGVPIITAARGAVRVCLENRAALRFAWRTPPFKPSAALSGIERGSGDVSTGVEQG